VSKGEVRSGYEGPAELVWGSWIVAGTANIRARASQEAPVGPSEGISTGPDDVSDEVYVGAFTADSGTEAALLTSLAMALGQTTTLRWHAAGRWDQLDITVTAKHGTRVHFETRR